MINQKDNTKSITFQEAYPEIAFEELTSKDVRKDVRFKAEITHVKKPEPILKLKVFECQTCMKHSYVKTDIFGNSQTPAVCSACAGRKFKFIPENSEFIDKQELIVSGKNTSKQILVILRGEKTSYDKYTPHQKVEIYGSVGVQVDPTKIYLFINCSFIHILQLEDGDYKEEKHPRDSLEYRNWKNTILNRDKTCQICGGHKHLQVHHLYSYKDFPELRVDTNNGLVLCSFCHSKFHSYYGKHVTPVDLIKFIMEFGRK